MSEEKVGQSPCETLSHAGVPAASFVLNGRARDMQFRGRAHDQLDIARTDRDHCLTSGIMETLLSLDYAEPHTKHCVPYLS